MEDAPPTTSTSAIIFQTRSIFFLPNPQCGPTHSPALPGSRPGMRTLRGERDAVAITNSETVPAFRRSKLAHRPMTENGYMRPLAAIAIAPPPDLRPQAPAPRIQPSSLASNSLPGMTPRFPWHDVLPPLRRSFESHEIFAPHAPYVQIIYGIRRLRDPRHTATTFFFASEPQRDLCPRSESALPRPVPRAYPPLRQQTLHKLYRPPHRHH